MSNGHDAISWYLEAGCCERCQEPSGVINWVNLMRLRPQTRESGASEATCCGNHSIEFHLNLDASKAKIAYCSVQHSTITQSALLFRWLPGFVHLFIW